MARDLEIPLQLGLPQRTGMRAPVKRQRKNPNQISPNAGPTRSSRKFRLSPSIEVAPARPLPRPSVQHILMVIVCSVHLKHWKNKYSTIQISREEDKGF